MSKPIRVLHVDDNRFDRELVTDAMLGDGAGVELVQAADRDQLTACLRQGPFDVVLTDFNILDLDGFGVIDLVRETLGDVPVLMVTGTGSEEIAVEALRRGVEDYVIKTPSHLRRLLSTIRSVLLRREEAAARRRAEQALKDSERTLRLAIGRFPGAFVIYGPDLRFRVVNEYSRRGVGLEAHQILGRTDADVFAPELVAQYMPTLRKALDTGEPQRCELHVPLPEGDFYVEVNYEPILDAEGRVEQILSTTHDVTERRHAAAHLAQSAQDMRSLIEASPVAIVALDAKGHVTVWNGAAQSIFGWNAAEVVGKAPPFLPPTLRADVVGALANGSPGAGSCMSGGEHRWARRDGTSVDVELATAVMRQSGGVAAGCLLIVQDVTAQKEARQERRLLVTAVDQVGEGIVITDADGVIQYANPAFEQMSGWSGDELVGHSTRMLRSGRHDDAYYQQMWSTILGGHTWTGRFVNRRKDGALFHDTSTISPVRGESGEIVAFVGVKRDITAELRAQERLEQAARMESIGLLAGGVAHDFNNLLTAIMSYTELLDASLAPGDERADDIGEIRRAAMRAATLTRQLLAFGRKQIIEPVALDVHTTIRETQSMLKRLIGEDIELSARLEATDSRIWADPAQIEQILVNLVVNARDAISDGGVIELSTRTVEIGEPEAEVLGTRPGPYILISVSDSGTGMTEETRARIFEPFFTTKARGHGTGLGLATVYGIVAQAGGRIDCTSSLGVGTTFDVYIPRYGGDAQEVQVTRPAPTVATGRGETILVVDDSDSVRMVVRRTLVSAGYKVLDAATPDSALAVVREQTESMQLLICDVVLPSMNGRDLARSILELSPGLPVLFISGYAESVIARHGVLDPGVQLLSKPFTPSVLIQRVRAILDA